MRTELLERVLGGVGGRTAWHVPGGIETEDEGIARAAFLRAACGVGHAVAANAALDAWEWLGDMHPRARWSGAMAAAEEATRIVDAASESGPACLTFDVVPGRVRWVTVMRTVVELSRSSTGWLVTAVASDGTPHGFRVELMREAAEREGRTRRPPPRRREVRSVDEARRRLAEAQADGTWDRVEECSRDCARAVAWFAARRSDPVGSGVSPVSGGPR